MKLLAGILGGSVVAALFAFAMATAGAVFFGAPESAVLWTFGLIWLTCIGAAMAAHTPAQAWHRLLLAGGLFAVLLPPMGIGVMVVGSMVIADSTGSTSNPAAAAAVYGLTASLFAGALIVVGSLFALIMIPIGLIVGKRSGSSKDRSNTELDPG